MDLAVPDTCQSTHQTLILDPACPLDFRNFCCEFDVKKFLESWLALRILSDS